MNQGVTLMSLTAAVETLRALYARVGKRPDFVRRVREQEHVLAQYQPLFRQPEGLTVEAFRSFLYFENNRHWTGLHRQVSRLLSDMTTLRQALGVLVDESRPLAPRFDQALKQVRGMGKALATAILLVAYPDRYGVWNQASEAALKILGIWPDFPRGTSPGQRYAQVNDILQHLSRSLDVDLWTLDWLFWELVQQTETGEPEEEVPRFPEETLHFRLERHLHDFLVENWEATDLGREWEIYREDEDLAGVEYPTGVGRIDILARHKSRPAWLVVELKRGRPADHVLGQLLRYIGWVRRHLAREGEEVYGLILAEDADPRLLYALQALDHKRIRLMRYRLLFQLEAIT